MSFDTPQKIQFDYWVTVFNAFNMSRVMIFDHFEVNNLRKRKMSVTQDESKFIFAS